MEHQLEMAGAFCVERGVFMYPVSEANRTAHCLELKAYDYMLRFEKSFNGIVQQDMITIVRKDGKYHIVEQSEDLEPVGNGGFANMIDLIEKILCYFDSCSYWTDISSPYLPWRN